MADETKDSVRYMNDYYSSRDAFIEELAKQTSLATGDNLYDRDNRISRMALRGDTKEAIKAALMKNSIFKANYESAGVEAEDVFDGISKLRFAEFNEALESIVDPKSEPNYRATAIELVASYDPEGAITNLIEGGATAYETLKALDGVPAWSADLADYMTRSDVDLPSDDQIARWSSFHKTVAAIKDLDDYQEASI